MIIFLDLLNKYKYMSGSVRKCPVHHFISFLMVLNDFYAVFIDVHHFLTVSDDRFHHVLTVSDEPYHYF